MLEASFTAQTIVIASDKTLGLIQLIPDVKFRQFHLKDANIESINLACLKLYVKSNGFNYEQYVNYFFDKFDQFDDDIPFSLDKDFIKNTNLKNIIKCGIFDILICDEHVQIFSNINPLNKLDEILVDDDILELLKSQKPIIFSHDLIACITQPLNEEDIQIQIIEVRQDKLVMKQSQKVSLKSPWNTLVSDCLYNPIKFYDWNYAFFIVTQPSKNEQYLQKYQYSVKNDKYEFLSQKQQNDFINVEQIPHLPLLNINGNKSINLESWKDNNIYQELDLRLDKQEIFNLEKENINSERVEVYEKNFLKYFFGFVEKQVELIGAQTHFDSDIKSIEIAELRTSIIIKSGGQNSGGVLIFQHSIDKIKHLKIKQPIFYQTHRVLYRDKSYYVCIILLIDDAIHEMRIFLDLNEVTLAPLKFITIITEEIENVSIYVYDDFKVSLFITGSDCCFKHFSLNSLGEQEKTFKIDFKDGKCQINIQQLSQFIKRIASSESTPLGENLFENFKSIIYKNAEELIKKEDFNVCVIAFQNKFIFFEHLDNSLITIMDDSFNLIGTLILSSKYPPHTIRIASSIDPGSLDYIDEFNNKYPFPIWGNLQDYKSNDERLDNYAKNVGYPMPFQFDKLDGFISHLDLQSEKLSFYKSIKDKKDGKISARIEVISRKQSIIDDIINCTERKDIEERMKKSELNLLLSYNANKRMNLILGTQNHSEKDHIYSVLQKLLEIADIKDLPMLIYNTSLDLNKYESIIDILIDNKAIKLAQFILRLAILQDQIGYIYSRLYQYLQIFSANELQMFFENQIFFFKIPEDCYEEYQIVNIQITPFSDCKTFFEIIKIMKTEKATVQDISDYDNSQQEKKKDMLEEKEVTVPTEQYAINLLNLIQSKNQSLDSIHENHREVTQILNKFVEIDERIIEKDSFQLIIDFKWDSYAWKFFSVQLVLFICFIIAFIFDVVAVSRNSHTFSSNDKNQAIPRNTSIAILIPFAIYEIAFMAVTRKKYFESFWNFNDVLLIALYVTYFTITFFRPEQEAILKSLQLAIVILSFIKFSFLIRIWTQVSFLVRMLIVVMKELFIFLLFFLLVIGGLTVMAQIIINQSRDQYEGIKLAAYFLIVLRQSIGDYDTTSIVEGTRDFKILAWLLWLLILLIGNVVFMNFIIAVVSESYESCMEKKVRLIYRAKLEMITECEDLMPDKLFKKENWFPRFIIIRRQQGSAAGGDNSDEWNGFVKQMQKHLQHETNKLNEIFIQNMNRSTDSSKKEIKAVQEKVTADIGEVKKDVSDVKKDVSDVKKETAKVQVQINEIKLILSAVFKDQIALMKAQEVQANDYKAI